MTTYIYISIISSKPLDGNYVSDLEDDFFYHFGDKYYPSISVFTLEDVESIPLHSSTILSVYDEDSHDLYRFLSYEGYDSEVSIIKGDSLSGISKKIILKLFGVVEKSVRATWKPDLFLFIEEPRFALSELDPISPKGEYPGVIPGDPEWVRPKKERKYEKTITPLFFSTDWFEDVDDQFEEAVSHLEDAVSHLGAAADQFGATDDQFEVMDDQFKSTIDQLEST